MREDQQTLSISETRNARGVVPQDYRFPDREGFVQSLYARLERLIQAGATDVETIAVLDEDLGSQLRLEHALLDSQRSTHVDVCKRIVGIARMNVTEAENDLKRATDKLNRAQKLFDHLEEKLDESDPNHNHHA